MSSTRNVFIRMAGPRRQTSKFLSREGDDRKYQLEPLISNAGSQIVLAILTAAHNDVYIRLQACSTDTL